MHPAIEARPLTPRRPSGREAARLQLGILFVTIALVLTVTASGLATAPLDFEAMALVGLVASIAGFSIWLLSRQGPVDPFNPLVLGAWLYLLPMGIIRPLYLAAGNYSSILAGAGDQEQLLQTALLYLAAGWAAMVLGYFLPPRSWTARFRPPAFLTRDLGPRPIPVVTFGAGLVFVLVLLVEHAYGSSLAVPTGNGAIVSLALPFSKWTDMSLFLLVFGPRGWRSGWWRVSLVAALVVTAVLDVLAGGRSDLTLTVILLGAAYLYSRRGSIRWRQVAPLLGAGGVTLLVGILVITQYRYDRIAAYGTSPISVTQTVDLLGGSVGEVSTLGLTRQGGLATSDLVKRLNSVDLLGATISEAPRLKTQESQVGIDNNILKETLWTFVPRFLYPDKPVLSNFGYWFSKIYAGNPYLDWSGPSAVGDLYRNFGNLGVILGMMLLGVYFRIIYDLLVRGSGRKPVAVLLFFFLVTSMNWEAEYANFITLGEQMLVVALALTAILHLLGGFEPGDRNDAGRALTQGGAA